MHCKGVGPSPKDPYIDASHELSKAVVSMGKPLGEPGTNGVAEAQVGRTVRGIGANLGQAGHPQCYWSRAAMHRWTARSICSKPRELIAWETWPGYPYQGQHRAYGAKVSYIPNRMSNNPSKKLDLNMTIGVFMGCHFEPGHVRKGAHLITHLSHFVGKDLRKDALHSQAIISIEHALSVDSVVPSEFPCKQEYKKANGTLAGMSGSDTGDLEVAGNGGDMRPAVNTNVVEETEDVAFQSEDELPPVVETS